MNKTKFRTGNFNSEWANRKKMLKKKTGAPRDVP